MAEFTGWQSRRAPLATTSPTLITEAIPCPN